MTNLIKLKQLTDELDFGKFVKSTGSYKEINGINGSIFLYGLFKNKYIAVSNGVGKKGILIHRHFHKQKEIVIVYKGKMTMTINGDKSIELSVGNILEIPLNILHKAEFLEDTEYIVITIPASDDFPDGDIK